MIERRPVINGSESREVFNTPISDVVRLNKFIANSGVCSRREADTLIEAGVVTVNGVVVTELGTKVNVHEDDIRFNGERLKGEEKMYLNHHDNGKPYLENCVTNISITHTDKYVAIIISDYDELGIDIESLERDFTAVEKKALSEDEIDDLDDEKKNEQLAIYWCAKEAIFKRMSQNRVDFAEQIEVEKFNVRKEGELEATFIHKDEHEEDFELEYMIFDRHVLVWLVG